MINCDQIAVESAKLKAMFTKCYNLKAIDLRSIVDLIESVSACSGGSFNLKTVNGQSLLGVGNIVVTAVVDGTETKVQQGSGITVTGNGSILNPYVVSNSSIVTIDGSETKINQGSNITIAGTGTVANPYVINAETQSQTPQVNADWASISGVSEILNKPTIPSAQGLQEVINVGSYAEKNTSYINFLAEEDGEITSDLRVYSEDLSKNSKVGLSGGVVEVANSNGLYTGFLNISDGIINIQETNETTGNITTFGFTSPIVSSSIKLPAKTVAGDYTLATTDEISNIDLQKVLTNGTYAEFDGDSRNSAYFLDGNPFDRSVEFYLDNGVSGSGNAGSVQINKNTAVEFQNYSGTKRGDIAIYGGNVEILQANIGTPGTTTISFTIPTVITSIKIPAKTTTGEYVLSTLDDIPIDKTGTGVFLRGRTAANYGTPGNRSFDISYAFTPSTGTPYGAIGSYSFAMGNRVSSNGYGASSFGYLIDNGGIGSFNSGYNMYDRGYTNFLTGIGHNVTSMNATVVGQAANIISESILDFNTVPTKALFTVGNGTIQNADSTYTVLTRSDAFKVRLNGSLEAPSLTTGLIDADLTGKILITKEYLNSSINLQKVLNAGSDASIVFGDNFSNLEITPTYVAINQGDNSVFSRTGFYINNGILSIEREGEIDISKTSIKIDVPTVISTLNFPAKTTEGDYTLATIDEINLQTVIDNGNLATVDYSGYFGVQLNGSPDISTVISPFGLTASTSGNTVYYNSTGITFKGKVNRFPDKLNTGEYTIVTTPTSSYTVSTLPPGQLNDIAVVTDATSPTYLGVLIGGGSVVAPVWHNGTNWVSR